MRRNVWIVIIPAMVVMLMTVVSEFTNKVNSDRDRTETIKCLKDIEACKLDNADLYMEMFSESASLEDMVNTSSDLDVDVIVRDSNYTIPSIYENNVGDMKKHI